MNGTANRNEVNKAASRPYLPNVEVSLAQLAGGLTLAYGWPAEVMVRLEDGG